MYKSCIQLFLYDEYIYIYIYISILHTTYTYNCISIRTVHGSDHEIMGLFGNLLHTLTTPTTGTIGPLL